MGFCVEAFRDGTEEQPSNAVIAESQHKARNTSPDDPIVFRSPRSQRQTRQSTIIRNGYSSPNESSIHRPEAYGSESDPEDNEEENEDENIPDDRNAHCRQLIPVSIHENISNVNSCRARPVSGSPTNMDLQVRKSRHLSYAPTNTALLGSPDAWPKDGRNVNLKHIQAYYGLSQEQAKIFLTQDAVERAMDGIKQLKLKYEKPSVPSINTVRQACKYEEMYGTAPKDFISVSITSFQALRSDMPELD